MNEILVYTMQDCNDLCGILARNGYCITTRNFWRVVNPYACIKDGFDEGVKVCKKAADEIIRNLLCLLEDFKDQIPFNEDLQKIKDAEDFLNK